MDDSWGELGFARGAMKDARYGPALEEATSWQPARCKSLRCDHRTW